MKMAMAGWQHLSSIPPRHAKTAYSALSQRQQFSKTLQYATLRNLSLASSHGRTSFSQKMAATQAFTIPLSQRYTFATVSSYSDGSDDRNQDKAIKYLDNGLTPSEPSPSPRKAAGAKRRNISKKEKPSPRIQLLQLRNIHPKDTIEQHFGMIARRTELSKLKWIQTLHKKMEKASAKYQQDGNRGGVNPLAKPLWKMTQEFMERKSIPSHCKNSFWNLIVAPTAKKRKKSLPSTDVSSKDVAILETFRDCVVQQPIFWSHAQKHSLSKFLKEQDQITLEEYQASRAKVLHGIHFESKVAADREKEAKSMAETLRLSLPPTYYRRLLKQMESLSSSQSGKGKRATSDVSANEPTKMEIQSGTLKANMQLYSHALDCVHGHIHLIAPDLADFCYLNVNTHTHESAIREPLLENVSSVTDADDRLQGYQDAWNEARDNFVESFSSIQAMLVKEFEEAARYEKDVQTLKSAKVTEASDGEKDGLDKSLSDDDLDDDGKDYDYDDSEESVLATFEEAAQLPEGADTMVAVPKMKHRHYIVYEAISVGNWATNKRDRVASSSDSQTDGNISRNPSAPLIAPADRLVFVDNLPIDITKERLLEAYSKCGFIEEVEIFQQRLDLDPGRKADDSKKKIRKPSTSRRRWERPRTPLYATILYRDAEGAAKATVDPLRIFGMVLNMHLIRSYRASDMTKLYLEDIAAGHDVTTIEYALSQVLHPELYVCLDVGRRQRRLFGPSSCEIKFTNFEAASWAYLKLSEELEFLKERPDCSLQWMKTPPDAMLYWTRQLNF